MPAPKYVHNLDLDGHEIKNVLVDRLDVLPAASAANAGRAVYFTPENKLLYSDGVSWQRVYATAVARAARVASTANVAIATTGNGATIDGVVIATGNTVLLKDQAAPAENGLYTVGANALTRAADADSAAELPRGALVTSTAGTANAGKTWQNDAAANYVLGTDPMPWILAPGQGGGNYIAGSGIDITGSTISRKRFTGPVPVPGAGTSVTITHNLNMDRPQVEVWIVADNSRAEGVYVQNVDANNILLDFAVAPANGQYEVVIG